VSNTELQPDESGAFPVRTGAPKTRKALSRLKRELTEVEISQPGVQKMILEDQERIEGENRELRIFRDKFYEVSLRVAVLEAERKRSIAWEVLSSGCLALGSVAIGFARSMWSSQPEGWEVLIFGAILLLVGIAARSFRQ
jgi:uncharacterized membrane-anchored protein